MEREFRYLMAIPLTGLESNHIGYYLRRARKVLDLKQSYVAEKTVLCESTISDLERYGVNPNFTTIQNYMKALGLEFYAFIPANSLDSGGVWTKSEVILVQIASDELIKIKKSA